MRFFLKLFWIVYLITGFAQWAIGWVSFGGELETFRRDWLPVIDQSWFGFAMIGIGVVGLVATFTGDNWRMAIFNALRRKQLESLASEAEQLSRELAGLSAERYEDTLRALEEDDPEHRRLSNAGARIDARFLREYVPRVKSLQALFHRHGYKLLDERRREIHYLGGTGAVWRQIEEAGSSLAVVAREIRNDLQGSGLSALFLPHVLEQPQNQHINPG